MTDPKTPVLEPAAQAFAAATAGPPFTYELPVEVSRKGLEDLQSSDELKPAADVTDVIVNTGTTGSVKVRIVRPPNSLGPLPVVLYTHGAGWVLGSPNTHERLARDLAVGANVAVVPAHYDRSPEASTRPRSSSAGQSPNGSLPTVPSTTSTHRRS